MVGDRNWMKLFASSGIRRIDRVNIKSGTTVTTPPRASSTSVRGSAPKCPAPAAASQARNPTDGGSMSRVSTVSPVRLSTATRLRTSP